MSGPNDRPKPPPRVCPDCRRNPCTCRTAPRLVARLEFVDSNSPVVTVNSQPAAWLEAPMLLTQAERAWWAQRLERYGR